MQRFAVFLALVLCVAAQAREASLEAPDTVNAGEKLNVHWEGPGNRYDRIEVHSAGAADDAKAISVSGITGKKNPISVVMPDSPGTYELRYESVTTSQVLARRPIEVVDVPTSLSAPDTVDTGATVQVSWSGAGNSYDRIELHTPGADDKAKALSVSGITSKKNPVPVTMPDEPGDYELRYEMAKSGRVLARRAIQVRGVPTSITAPEQAEIGATIEITWEGPGNDYDKIILVEAGAPDNAREIVGAAILDRKPVLTLRLPEEAGQYELRYRTMRSKRILARRSVTVAAVNATLEAPERAVADTTIDVGWSGPGNDYDSIALYAEGAPAAAEPLATSAILGGRNPVSLKLPRREGRFELRYVTTQSKQVLARRPIVVEPAGRLAVVFEREGQIASTHGTGSGAVELILDASGSMLQRENGVRRIEIARSVLDELVREHLSEDRDFALRVFGHKEADKCRTDLEIPLSPLNRQTAAARIASINAKNLARTPIADSLAQVPNDLAKASGPKTVVLVTDGEETCDGDPAAVIRALRARGLELQVSIVGFAIEDPGLREQFQHWAELGGGSYFDARSADELIKSLRTVISGPYRVLDSANNPVAGGIIGGAEIVLPAGTYRLETTGETPRVIENVRIQAGELTTAAF